MSNLAQQFISQSYQSVINVGTGSGASINTTLQPLTDGYGTVSPLSVSTTGVAINGTVYITGSIIPAGSGSFDIGTPTNPFRHAYFSSQSIYLDGHQILSLDTSNNTTLAAPSGSNDLRFVNNITFDSSTDAAIGAQITYLGRGTNNQTQFNYSGSYNFHNTNGNLTFLNTMGAGDTTSSGSIVIDTKNGGNIGLHSENIIDIAAVYGNGNVNLNLRDNINSPFNVLKQINLDEFALLLESNDGSNIRLHNNSGSIILDANQYVNVTGSQTGIKGGISMNAANINLTENNGSGLAQGIMTLYGPNPGFNLQLNTNYSGSQYPVYGALFSSASYPADIYAGFQTYDADTFLTAIAAVGSTYTSQYPGQVVGVIAGGAQFNGSDTSIIIPASNAVVDVVKPLNINAGASVSGSLNVTGSLIVNGGTVGAPFPYVGVAQITGSLLVTEGGAFESGAITLTNNANDPTQPVVRVNGNNGVQPYPGNQIQINTDLNEGNIYAFFAIDDIGTGSANLGGMGMAVQTFTPYTTGSVGTIYGGGNGIDSSNTILYNVGSNVVINKNTNFAGYVASANSFTQAGFTTNQTVSAGSDTVVNFNTVNVNNNGWFDTTTHVFTPTVAGTYEISFALQVDTGTSNGQMNAQINKNNGTQVLIIQDEVNKNQPHSMLGSTLVEMNGSTDNIRITFYTSSGNGSQTILGGNGTKFIAKLL